MAKDGTNRGGLRAGVGRKKRPVAEKLLEGNPGKRPLKVLEFSPAAPDGLNMPPPHEFLSAKQPDGGVTLAAEIYENTWRWICERGCERLITTSLVEQYAVSVARWVQCDEAITKFGFLAKHPTTGNAIQSPYVAMSQLFLKQAGNLWYQIWQIVRENSAADYNGANTRDDVMERLLSAPKN